ncbi:MAG TPA: (2Fe-2S) ferredoxin domain-containing protein, partial [Gemmata sp.]
PGARTTEPAPPPQERSMTDPPATARRPLAQLVFCQGCCCGRTDRGRPEVPVGRLKGVWKDEKLNRSVQLTISGCLGPCDLANVALIITPSGNRWFGGLAGAAVYEELIAWARECHREGRVTPLPSGFEARRFERFGAQEGEGG